MKSNCYLDEKGNQRAPAQEGLLHNSNLCNLLCALCTEGFVIFLRQLQYVGDYKSEGSLITMQSKEYIVGLFTLEILPYTAVFRSIHRTADLGSSMDTFLCG